MKPTHCYLCKGFDGGTFRGLALHILGEHGSAVPAVDWTYKSSYNTRRIQCWCGVYVWPDYYRGTLPLGEQLFSTHLATNRGMVKCYLPYLFGVEPITGVPK